MSRFEKPEECCVCLEEFADNDDPLFPCGHWVHPKCVALWGNEQCPLCKGDVDLPEKYKRKAAKTRQRKRDEMMIFDDLDDFELPPQMIQIRIISRSINVLATEANINRHFVNPFYGVMGADSVTQLQYGNTDDIYTSTIAEEIIDDLRFEPILLSDEESADLRETFNRVFNTPRSNPEETVKAKESPRKRSRIASKPRIPIKHKKPRKYNRKQPLPLSKKSRFSRIVKHKWGSR